MRTWLRTAAMHTDLHAPRQETWTSRDDAGDGQRSYAVNVRLGKPIDILSLKTHTLDTFRAEAARLRAKREMLFASSETEALEHCPICRAPASDSRFQLNVDGARYHQCLSCRHCFVINRPTRAALAKRYAGDVDCASTYTDAETVETRVRQIAVPKAQWVIEQFESLHRRRPVSLLDVGAGAGHFVHACRTLGIEARGIEISEPARRFCRDTFGFELSAADFARDAQPFAGVEAVTFWGVIEHVGDPIVLLETAAGLLNERAGLVVVEVPLWDSLSTAIQTALPEAVIRHLDPLGHIHCFTESSLCTAFELSGLAPAAAWYFGMDVYELATQLSHGLQDDRVLDALAPHLSSLQGCIDRVRLCDAMVLAGRPMR